MSEAIFTLSADIVPQINERELEKQAQSLARQLNGILAKQTDKVAVAPKTGSFRPFQQEVQKAQSFVHKLQDNLSELPRRLGNVARAGKSAFLKFTDVIGKTRRDIVGFSGGILDSIKKTTLFKEALEGVEDAGGALSQLPQQFGDLAAQIQSGTSVIDQMAAGGDRLAQVFQPIQRQGEAARTEFVELNRSIDILIGAIGRIAGAATSTGSVIENQFGQAPFDQAILKMEELKNIAGLEGTAAFNKLQGSINQAFRSGNFEGIAKELVDIKNETQRLTGPLGRVAQFINERTGGRFFADVTEEARKTALELRQGVNRQLKEMGRSDLLGPIERISEGFRSIGRAARATGDTISTASNAFLTITRLKAPVEALVSSFDTLAAGIVTKLKGGFDTARTQVYSILDSLGTIISGRLDRALAPVAGTVGRAFGNVGKFLETNLNTPMRQGLETLRVEATRLGGDITGGLKKGLEAGVSALKSIATSIRDVVVGGLKKLFRTGSDSKVTEAIGKDVASGFAAGIRKGAVLVANAIGSLAKGLASLAAGGVQFVKSASIVAGSALAGLGAIAIKTGADFNVLQQVINSTLPVLVGSKQASAELLAEINALNDESPFARSSFLELTRVLAGFGVEAKKITPLIDSIQQAVAATGGGEQDLLELGQAFARVQSQGRLSGDILQSFSSRGIDVVQILGQEFDKTGSEIREMISGGLIPADKAIDALTKGMKAKFDGATDAVSKNFPGAMDRIRAKLRDTGAELTRAFINPEGGGALVDFLNSISNSINHISDNLLPTIRPLLEFVAFGFHRLGEGIERVVKAIDAADVSAFVDKMASIAPILAVLLGFFPNLLAFIPVVGPLLANLGGGFTAIALVIGLVAAKSEEVRNAIEPLIESFKNLFSSILPVVQNVLPALEDLVGAIVVALAPFIAHLVNEAVPFIQKLGEVFKEVVVQAQPVAEAFGQFLTSLKPVVTLLFDAGNTILGLVQSAAGPLSKVLVKIFEALSKIAPIVNVVVTRFLAAGGVKLLFGQIDKLLLLVNTKLITAAASSRLFGGALQSVAGAAATASGALSAILGPVGLIITGISLLTLFTSKSDSASDSISKLGNAALGTHGKFKALFNTKDIDKFSVSLAELEAQMLEVDSLKAGTRDEEGNFIGDTDDVDKINEIDRAIRRVTEDQKEALTQAKQAGEQGFAAEAQAAVDALDKNGNFLIKDRDLRAKLHEEILRGVANQAKANILQEESQSILDKTTEKLKQQKDAHAAMHPAAVNAGQAIQDAYNGAAFALGAVQTRLSNMQDTLKQTIQTVDSLISPVIEGTKALAAAQASVTTATEKHGEALATVTQLQTDYAKALRDVISPENELAVAERAHTRIKNDLVALDREEIRNKEELAKLRGKEADDQRGALDRGILRSQIALNKARQDEIDLKNKLNGVDKVSIDLTGLSLDQIRSKLRAVRATKKAQKGERDLTEQEKSDQLLSAKLDVTDAEAAHEAATTQRQEFEIDNAEKIRDLEERQLEIGDDKLDKLLEQENSHKGILKLREGETAQQAIILDFDEKIKGAKDDVATAATGIETALDNVITVQNDLNVKTATLRGDAEGIAAAYFKVWEHKRDGLVFDQATETALDNQISSVATIIGQLGTIKGEVAATARELAKYQAILDFSGSFEVDAFALGAAEGAPVTTEQLNEAQKNAKKPIKNALAAVLTAGGITGRATTTGELNRFVDLAFTKLSQEQNKNPLTTLTIRDILKELLREAGLFIENFAGGYAPGELIHRGMNDGVGIARMFEYGREAVLPLTRKFDMARVVTNPHVLPKILEALPRWRMPSASISDSSSVVDDLTSVVRTARSGSGPANSDVYRKKERREFASTIGSAVKAAVIEALAESESISGADVDINVLPSTGNEQLIAREVKRQLQKAMGRW